MDSLEFYKHWMDVILYVVQCHKIIFRRNKHIVHLWVYMNIVHTINTNRYKKYFNHFLHQEDKNYQI